MAAVSTKQVLLGCILWLGFAASCSGQPLPGLARDIEFDAYLATLDLERPEYEFLYKSDAHEGSSVGFYVAAPGHRKDGAFVPYNSSSDPEAEVATYRLARLLGVSDIYNPVGYYTLGPLATARFKTLLATNKERIPDRVANYSRIIKQLKATPNSIFGIYRSRPKGKKYAALSLGTNGQFNTGHPLAAFIRADGPMPSDKLISLPGVHGQRPEYPTPAEKESEIARQLSIILLIDQLTGQWDRFWRNLEATGDKRGRLRLLARDNGGANLDDGWEWHARYQKWVTRYDQKLVQQLKSLNGFLQGRSKRYGDFDSVKGWKSAAGFLKDSSFNTFKRKLAIFADKTLPAREKQFGEKTYFATQAATASGDAQVGEPD